MMNHSSKSQCKINPGTVITGKWYQNQYTIVKELGYGANGVVYLAEHNGTKVALKMSDNSISITSEVNVLKSFAKVQGSALGPCLLDADDWQSSQGKVSFYVMEYIHGPDFLSFIRIKGKSWTIVLLLQLLKDLDRLHQNGWVFGDLKPENLIVTGPPARIRCIDVGGTTIQGRAIKEFTEFYDRGYWGLGTRKADPSYDLFAVAMIMLNTAYPNRFEKVSGGMSQLRDAIRQKPELIPYKAVIEKALNGGYKGAVQMRTELMSIVTKGDKTDIEPRSPQPKKPAAKQMIDTKRKDKPLQSRQNYKRKKRKKGWLETIFIMLVLFFIYVMYIMVKLV